MTNIEKIRQEIENSIKAFEFNGGIYDSYEAGGLSAYKEILAFIDSLPDETCKDSLQVHETSKENTDSFTSELNNELENYYGRVPDDDDKINAARHFAEWGASWI